MLIEAKIHVILLGRNPAKLKALKAELGTNSDYFLLDMEQTDSIEPVVEMITNKYKQIDILINCAGVGYFVPIKNLKLDDLEQMFKVNVLSIMEITRCFLPFIEKSVNGQIINIESIAASKGFKYGSGYVASKFALAGFTDVLWKEVKASEIKVCSIRPGLVNTNLIKTFSDDDALSVALSPDDVAHTVRMVVMQSELSNISEITLRPIKRQAQDLFVNLLNQEYED